jgi:hypothetical protein
LKQVSIASRIPRDGSFEACAVAGRVLILLTAALLVVMPWTEYYCHFDKFLRGGQDFELGLLSSISIFCLVLVLLQHGRQSVMSLLALLRWLSLIFQHADPAVPGSLCRLFTALHAVPLPSPALGMYNLPIRI